MSAHFRPIILNAFPERTCSTMRRCVTQGVSLADALIQSEQMLNWAVGRDQRGDLCPVGVMWTLREACKDKTLPFVCEDKINTAKNCHHIEVRSQNVYTHINRTSSLLAMPRDTTLRNNERASNQGELFDQSRFTTELSEIKSWYAWLTFDADEKGKLTHLAIGLPANVGNDWLDIVSLLTPGHEQFGTPGDEPKPPGPAALMKFKEAYRKVIEKPADDAETEKK